MVQEIWRSYILLFIVNKLSKCSLIVIKNQEKDSWIKRILSFLIMYVVCVKPFTVLSKLCMCGPNNLQYISYIGFLSNTFDISMFTFHHKSNTINLLLYVDYIILTTSSFSLISKIISQLLSKFPMYDLGSLLFCWYCCF